jgi:asparagine N-glycosylation enzyme membrane subunit Stt3
MNDKTQYNGLRDWWYKNLYLPYYTSGYIPRGPFMGPDGVMISVNYEQTKNKLEEIRKLYEDAVNGRLADITGGATYYYNPDVVKTPDWASANDAKYLGKIGDHLIYVSKTGGLIQAND